MDLRFLVSDLLAHPGTSRAERATVEFDLQLRQAGVTGPVDVEVELRSLADGVEALGVGRGVARLVCGRCLMEWEEAVEVEIRQIYRRQPDEDGWALEEGGWVDLGPLLHDELALGLPRAPLCRPDCKGLCPVCGSDLNTAPCAGHGDESRSPFAVLRQLLDPAD